MSIHKILVVCLVLNLSACKAITSEPGGVTTSPNLSPVTSAYAYQGYNYYPTRPTVFEQSTKKP